MKNSMYRYVIDLGSYSDHHVRKKRRDEIEQAILNSQNKGFPLVGDSPIAAAVNAIISIMWLLSISLQ